MFALAIFPLAHAEFSGQEVHTNTIVASFLHPQPREALHPFVATMHQAQRAHVIADLAADATSKSLRDTKYP